MSARRAKHLWVNQYGDRIYAPTRRELLEQVRARYGLVGRVSPMYRDMPGGGVCKVGLVTGALWWSEFAPVMVDVSQ